MVNNIQIIYFEGDNSYLSWCKIGYTVSSLKEMDDTQIFVDNVNINNINESIEKIKCNNPSIIIVFLKSKTYNLAKSFINTYKKDIASVFICGCHTLATSFPKKILEDNSNIDSVIFGEEDIIAYNLCKTLFANESLENCSGIAYKNGKEVKVNTPFISNYKMDDLPFPDRYEFPHNKKFFHILGSRGCLGNCSFCNMNVLYKNNIMLRQKFRSIDNIVTEIDYLVNEFDCKYVGFSDSTFCGIKDKYSPIYRLKELYNSLSYKEYNIQFFLNMRAEQITEESIIWLEKLNEIGLSIIFIGFESFNNNDLKLYNKIATCKENINAVRLINKSLLKNKHGFMIDLQYGFINFNPYSTLENIKENVNYLRKFELKLTPKILLSKIAVHHGTAIHKRLVKDNLCSSEVKFYDSTIEYKFVDSKVNRLYNILHNFFKDIDFGNYDHYSILYNRYINLYGITDFIVSLNKTYKQYLILQSDFCFNIFCEAIQNINIINENKYDYNFNENITFEKLKNNKMKLDNKLNRLYIELARINQLSYF
ncbi:hypothetical protein SH1V18_28670 [Vallitalea longa]|uniref:Elp3/MiaA/NifB-like radical SAM core domain-containing protein n=1 Tax=Vallitalea longa TaxID=2936439 RepID=A0A9W5YBE3_9FIRM|nr:radical SAM protein [Vallitalea longa]GKX30387.1 hypothetical protein SH1V18_28670 [Vallitalea longa]